MIINAAESVGTDPGPSGFIIRSFPVGRTLDNVKAAVIVLEPGCNLLKRAIGRQRFMAKRQQGLNHPRHTGAPQQVAYLGLNGTDTDGRMVSIDIFQGFQLNPVTDPGGCTMGFDIVDVPERYIGSDIFKTALKGHGLSLFTGRRNGLTLAVRTGTHAFKHTVNTIVIAQGILHAL